MLHTTIRKARDAQMALGNADVVTRDDGRNVLVVVEFPEDARCVGERMLDPKAYRFTGVRCGGDVLVYRDRRGEHGMLVICPAFQLGALAGKELVFTRVIALGCSYVARDDIKTLLDLCDGRRCLFFFGAMDHIGWIDLAPGNKEPANG